MPPLLEIKDLSVAFGGATALSRAGFSVDDGSFTALVGESGSGKSVTALSICRLLWKARVGGSALWAPPGSTARDLLRLPEADLRAIRGGEISYVFQDPASSFNPLLTVGEQVGEAFRTHRGGSPAEVRQKALRGLEEARIRDAERVYRSYPHELSGGLKQRAMIAMALIAGPRLLVADEPTTALDVTTEAEILELLAEIRREKALTVLFITHDLPLAAAYAGRIVVMEKGRVVECMDKDGGGFRPGNAYTKRLFGVDLARSVPKQRIGA